MNHSQIAWLEKKGSRHFLKRRYRNAWHQAKA